jgi:hypothetical protein
MRDLINLINNNSTEPSVDQQLTQLAEDLNSLAEVDNMATGAEPNYAVKSDYDAIAPALTAWLKNAGVENPNPEFSKKGGRLPLFRMSNVTPAQLAQAAEGLGLTQDPDLTELQSISSGQFDIYSYSGRGLTFTFVLRGVKVAQSFAGAAGDLVLNRKDLTPVKLGMAGDYSDRKQLADATKSAVTSKVKNEKIAKALIELVDIAMARGAGQLSPDSLEYIKPIRGMISQDFGEILAPLALAEDGQSINFPVGNEKLIDVTVGGNVRYSVKALGGSGTSMNSLGSLLDEYDLTLTDEGKKKLFRDGIKVWQTASKKEGKVVDRICYAAFLNQTPEYLSYVDILGGEFKDFDELKSLLKKALKNLDYKGFLELVVPASQAGHWGTNVGMPQDSEYYLGNTDKKPKAGVAGRVSYEHDPINGAANIITYSLGKSFEFMVKRGPNKQQYKDIMNDMIKQMNCQLGHVDITIDGKLAVTSKPFGNLDFEFDYHAPSHIAGNNRPGFMIVPPNKGDKGKKKSDSEGSDIHSHSGSGSAEPEPTKKLKDPTKSMAADVIKHPGKAKPKSGNLGRERR